MYTDVKEVFWYHLFLVFFLPQCWLWSPHPGSLLHVKTHLKKSLSFVLLSDCQSKWFLISEEKEEKFSFPSVLVLKYQKGVFFLKLNRLFVTFFIFNSFLLAEITFTPFLISERRVKLPHAFGSYLRFFCFYIMPLPYDN